MTYSSEIEDLRLRLAESERVRRQLAEALEHSRMHGDRFCVYDGCAECRKCVAALVASDVLDGEGS